MSLRDTIQIVVREQGESIIQKDIFVGIMDDYGAFNDELPAVKEIFRKLAQNGYITRLTTLSSKKKSWEFDVKSIIQEASDNYGYQKMAISDILKEISVGTGIISSDDAWKVISDSITLVSQGQNSNGSQGANINNVALKKKSFWEIFSKKNSPAPSIKINKYGYKKFSRNRSSIKLYK